MGIHKRAKVFFRFFILSSVFCLLFSAVAEANIVVRSMVVNPSSQKRKVPFKAYMPKEIKPENIVDMGDLEVAFDPQSETYYVFKDYELDSKEFVQVEVELQDVWKIPAEETSSLREEAGKVAKILSNTDYYERASYLKNSIESKLNQVEESQRIINPNPGGYISDFRENAKLIEAVKADLAAAKTLVAQAKNIAPMVTWKLVLSIVVFLGLLGLVFFVIWQRQIKSITDLTQEYKEAESLAPGQSGEVGEHRQASGEEKKSNISDIEDRLKK